MIDIFLDSLHFLDVSFPWFSLLSFVLYYNYDCHFILRSCFLYGLNNPLFVELTMTFNKIKCIFHRNIYNLLWLSNNIYLILVTCMLFRSLFTCRWGFRLHCFFLNGRPMKFLLQNWSSHLLLKNFTTRTKCCFDFLTKLQQCGSL